jgi:ankyrin repeat protein
MVHTALHLAVIQDNVEVLNLLLEYLSGQQSLAIQDVYGNTALH